VHLNVKNNQHLTAPLAQAIGWSLAILAALLETLAMPGTQFSVKFLEKAKLHLKSTACGFPLTGRMEIFS
jgi:hypothetical protein